MALLKQIGQDLLWLKNKILGTKSNEPEDSQADSIGELPNESVYFRQNGEMWAKTGNCHVRVRVVGNALVCDSMPVKFDPREKVSLL